MKRWIAILALLAAACVPPTQPPTPTPIPPPVPLLAFDYAACRTVPADNYCDGMPATITLTPTTTTDPPRVQTSDGNGYFWIAGIPPTWTTVDLRVDAVGYKPYAGRTTTAALIEQNALGLHNMQLLDMDHVDPSLFTLDQLAAIRGAMWPQGLGLPLGPRPGAPDNIIATDFFNNYSPADQARILVWEHEHGYTHVVVGPIVDSDGYHGIYTPNDWRGKFEEFLDILQTFYDHGLIPVIFIHPDNWTLDETKALTPLFTTARAQKLMRVVIPSGWEPTKYGWSSCTWAGYVSWARTTWPNAVVGIHTVADVDAPVGTDALCDDNGQPNGKGWQRVADAGLHLWFVQNGAYTTGPAADRTLAYNFAGQFSTGPDGEATHGAAWHFANGIASWPTTSAWPTGPIRMVAAEHTSYTAFWGHILEADREAWGNLAVGYGARGYLDGGTVPVP